MEWIDAHVHIGEDVDGIVSSYEDVEYLFAEDWIDKAVVFALHEEQGIDHGNRHIRDLVRDDDRLAGLFRVDPAEHILDDLAAAGEDDGFAGFKMHPRAQHFAMHEVHEMLDLIGDLDVPVLVHTGVGDTGGFNRAHPEAVLDAAATHQDTDIILAHTTKGYYYHAPESFRNTFNELDNAYLDISLHCTPLGIETLADDLGADRILFASDFPYGHPVPMQKNVEYATIPDHAAERIAWKNAERLFF
jgi:predicted TIM-barrel fold metal-dependent hydrolase